MSYSGRSFNHHIDIEFQFIDPPEKWRKLHILIQGLSSSDEKSKSLLPDVDYTSFELEIAKAYKG